MDRFRSSLKAELLPGRKKWRIIDDFSYIPPGFTEITVPAGFETDFASVPRWPLTFALVGSYGHAAAVIHDFLYSTGQFTREESDRIFHEALRSNGIARWRAWLMYYGVRIGGKSRYLSGD